MKTQSPPSQGEVILPSLKYFAKPVQKISKESLAAVSPKFADALSKGDKEFIEWASGFFSAFGFDLGLAVPEWTKAASRKFWEGMGLDFLTSFQGTPSQLGKIIGFIDLAPTNGNPSKPEQAIENLAQVIKSEAVNSRDTHLEFAKARANVPKIIERFAEPNQRTIIFGIIAAGWRKVEKFNSTEELYDWLKSLKNTDAAAAYTIARATESREIRKVCKRIGLKFENKWTSPKQ